MEEQNKSTQPGKGVADETASKAADSTQQVNQVQNSGQHQGRDDGQSQSSSTVESRPPSYYYKNRQKEKKKVQALEKQIEEMSKQMERMQNMHAESQQPKLSPQDQEAMYLNNPIQFMQERDRQLREEMAKEYEQKMVQMRDDMERINELKRQEREALELLYPKANSSDPSQVVGQDDPERDEILEILETYGLEELSHTRPLEAAKATKEILEARRLRRSKQDANPSAISKDLMGSTQGGNVVSSNEDQNQARSMDDIRRDMASLKDRLSKNPDVRFEDSYKQESMKIKNELSEAIRKEQNKVE